MKKHIFSLFMFVVIFLAMPIYVNAFPNGYAYDINNVSVVGSNLVIEGWAAIDGSGTSPIHNINPKYTLSIVGKSANGKQVGSAGPYANLRINRPPYSSSTAMPRDYTKPWYSKNSLTSTPCGTPAYYPSSFTSHRGCLVKNSLSSGNRFYINIDFKFQIPITSFKNLLKTAKKVYFNLDVQTTANTHTVFGHTGFKSVNASKTIPLAIKNDRVSEITREKFEGLSFNATPTKIGLNVSTGYVQGNPNKFLGSGNYPLYYDRYKKEIRKKKSSDTTYSDSGWNVRKVSYYGSFTSTNNLELYNILGSTLLTDANNGANYYYYTVKIAYDSNYKVKNATKGVTSYIPAFWAVAEPGVLTYITGEEDPDPDPDPDLCLDITDPQKRYCCYYPEDKEACESKTGQYPEKDPTNKSGTCKSDALTSVTFKYPKSGWGQPTLNNNACSISCHEELRVTFDPSKYVKAGMGFSYPIVSDSSRYCTAEYKNAGWKSKVDTAAKAANSAYDSMLRYIDEAKDLDNKCGTSTILTQSPKNNCTGNYTLVSGECRRRVTYKPSCEKDCTRNGSICNCHIDAYCLPPCTNPEQKGCKENCFPRHDWTENACGSDKYDGTDCWYYSYKDACDSGYYLDGTTCKRKVCSKTSEDWSSAQSAIAAKLSSANNALGTYNTNVSKINTLNGERNTCDNYVILNQYRGGFNTSISTSGVPNQSGYIKTAYTFNEDTTFESGRKSKTDKYAIYDCTDRPYYASKSLVGDHKTWAQTFAGSYCDYKTKTVEYSDFWNKKSDANITFGFSKLYYVQRYTGELSTTSGDGYDKHGRVAYTGFYDQSGSNSFSLSATNIGPNLPIGSHDLWSINSFTCEYVVDNLLFPPKSDDNYKKYGSVAFMYRQVALDNPFPNRSPNSNWTGKEKLITSKGYDIYTENPLYFIKLNPHVMRDIRREGTDYASFNIKDPYKSKLVQDLINRQVIIKGKR